LPLKKTQRHEYSVSLLVEPQHPFPLPIYVFVGVGDPIL